MSRDKSRTGTGPPLSEEARRLNERRLHALRDLEELAEQVAIGELDEQTADRLRAGYQSELEAVELALQGAEPVRPAEVSRAAEPAERSRGRAMTGAFLLIGAFTVVILLAAQTFRSDGDPGPATPSDVATVDGALLEEMEDVVAAHPDNIGMRMALADLYFDQGEYGSAIDHYVVVLAGEMTVEEESRTLGRIGWMAYSTGQTGVAVDYLNASLTADPEYAEGKLFLGLVKLYGLEDAAGALPLLEEVLALPGLGDGIRIEVEAAVNDARSVVAP